MKIVCGLGRVFRRGFKSMKVCNYHTLWLLTLTLASSSVFYLTNVKSSVATVKLQLADRTGDTPSAAPISSIDNLTSSWSRHHLRDAHHNTASGRPGVGRPVVGGPGVGGLVLTTDDAVNVTGDYVLFTTFVNFKERLGIQRLVIQNWSQFFPRVYCVLFTSFEDFRMSDEFRNLVKFAIESKWLVVRIPKMNHFRTPYLFPMFEVLINRFNATFYGYINGDNLFDHGLVKTLDKIKLHLHQWNRSVLITGMRRNIVYENSDSIEIGPWWKPATIHEIAKRMVQSYPSNPYSEEYFFVTKQFPHTRFKAMLVGRPGVDNYLVIRAKQLGLTVIDGSETITDVHLQAQTGRTMGKEAVDWNLNIDTAGRDTHWSEGTAHATHLKSVWRLGQVVLECQAPYPPLPTLPCRLNNSFEYD